MVTGESSFVVPVFNTIFSSSFLGPNLWLVYWPGIDMILGCDMKH